MKSFTLLLSALLLFASCSKTDITDPKNDNPPPSSLQAATLLNESYGSDALQKYDIHLPAGRTTATKVMVLIHGGAWASGDKNDFATVIDSLKKRLPDWAFVNVNYRLINLLANYFPAQENDIAAAITKVFNKRQDYSISDKWVLVGASAGGHLALLQGYKYTSPLVPKAIVNYFGPSDLIKLTNETTDFATKAAMQITFGNYAGSSSPINYITAQTPPTITLQGINDNTIPLSQQEALHTKLKANNVPEQLIKYENEGHGFSSGVMTKSYDAVIAFLNTHVK